jgi:retron-type reverse transcriptase
MKRIGNLYDYIISVENLNAAERKARHAKGARSGLRAFDSDRENNIAKLHEVLERCDYNTSAYNTFTIYEPKERQICKLPYYPDRIVHHAIMNVMEPIWVSMFTADTYSCLKKRGIHACAQAVKRTLKEYPEETAYCLKLDIRKFYQSINHAILKQLLRRKLKDERLLNLLDEIIDSHNTLPPYCIRYKGCGIPIGNYLSQYLANLYLTYFDHWLKEVKNVRFYYRYADDIVIFSDNKETLHALLHNIRAYLWDNLKLTIKPNYQVFPTDARGIDYVGYRFWHTHTLMRKRIKHNLCRAVAKMRKHNITDPKAQRMALCGWIGWSKYCNSINLLNKLNIKNL